MRSGRGGPLDDRVEGASRAPGPPGAAASAGVLVVAAALVDELATPATLLAARRSAPSDLAGGWELPGGKVEPGEAPDAALHRELLEELDVRVELGERLLSAEGDGDWPLGWRLRLRVWTARVVAGTPRPLEDHDRLELLDGPRWRDVAWLPGDVPPVAELARRAGW